MYSAARRLLSSRARRTSTAAAWAASSAYSRSAAPSPSRPRFPTPKEIRRGLDEFVVDQHKAKKYTGSTMTRDEAASDARCAESEGPGGRGGSGAHREAALAGIRHVATRGDPGDRGAAVRQDLLDTRWMDRWRSVAGAESEIDLVHVAVPVRASPRSTPRIRS
ncbi:hypothetical protein ACP4OV_014508 [Aristida adscensionis]